MELVAQYVREYLVSKQWLLWDLRDVANLDGKRGGHRSRMNARHGRAYGEGYVGFTIARSDNQFTTVRPSWPIAAYSDFLHIIHEAD